MKLNKISLFLIAIVSLLAFNSCEETEIERANYISFEKSNYDFPVEVGDQAATAEIKVFTTRKSGSDRTFTINVNQDLTTADPGSYTIDQTVTVPANSTVGTFSVESSDANIGEAIVVEFATEEGIFTGDPMTIQISQLCTTNPLTLIITFDNYPEETSWEIYHVDDLVNPIANGGENGGYADMTSITQLFCLDDGDYYFVIYDVYADGICCSYGNGSYELLNSSGTAIVSGGAFGANEVTPFT